MTSPFNVKTPEQIAKHVAYAALCSKNLGRGIVVGLVVERFTTETQYAILADGRMASCTVKRPNSNFGKHRNGHRAKWLRVMEIPAHAEYTGTYDAGLVDIGAARSAIHVEILQGSGVWLARWEPSASVDAAVAEANAVTAKYFTAARVVVDGLVVHHSLPQFPDVAYVGDTGKAARDVLAALDIATAPTTADDVRTLTDSDGRLCSLTIDGADIDAEIAAGKSASEARRCVESKAFANAIARGEIGPDAWATF